MKAIMPTLLLSALVCLSGCSIISQLPANSCDTWAHTFSIGPIYAEHFTASGASKTPDGTIHIQNYTGSISYMGVYTMTDTIQGLTVSPKTAK